MSNDNTVMGAAVKGILNKLLSEIMAYDYNFKPCPIRVLITHTKQGYEEHTDEHKPQ